MHMEDLIRIAREKQADGDLDAAADCYRRILCSEPENHAALFHWGCMQLQNNRAEEGLAMLGQSIALCDQEPAYFEALGTALQKQGQYARAEEVFRRALTHFPCEPALNCGLGDALQSLGQLDAALEAYRKTVTSEGTHGQAWYGMGCALMTREAFAAAVPCFNKTLALMPGHLGARHNLAKALFNLGLTEAAFAHFQTVAEQPGGELSLTAMALGIPQNPRADNRMILEVRKAWGERHIQIRAPIAAAGRPAGSGPMRIGYVSSFFHQDNYMKPVWGLINHHNRDVFEIHLFADCAASALKNGYGQDARDGFHDISRLSNAESARVIAENKIDILVDLNGYSQMNRLPLFGHRPAPVIAGWLNMYATTGLACFDYLIGDGIVIPPQEDVYYTEKILRTAGSYLSFDVRYPVPEVDPPPCATKGFVTLGCFASQYKITTGVVQAWAEILRPVPDCRLLIKNTALGIRANRDSLINLFAAFDIPPPRLRLEGPLPHYDFLACYKELDLALDTFPYNGGTTTSEAIWQGVPVLAFRGDRWVARTSASILQNARLGDFVAADRAGYIAKAVQIANDPDTPARLAELRSSMRRRLRESICDTKAFAADMEGLYRWMQNQAQSHREG